MTDPELRQMLKDSTKPITPNDDNGSPDIEHDPELLDPEPEPTPDPDGDEFDDDPSGFNEDDPGFVNDKGQYKSGPMNRFLEWIPPILIFLIEASGEKWLVPAYKKRMLSPEDEKRITELDKLPSEDWNTSDIDLMKRKSKVFEYQKSMPLGEIEKPLFTESMVEALSEMNVPDLKPWQICLLVVAGITVMRIAPFYIDLPSNPFEPVNA